MASEPAADQCPDYARLVPDRLTHHLRIRVRLVVALMSAIGLGAMCTVVATTGPMAHHSASSRGDMSMADAGAASADAIHPLVSIAEKACADCSTAECAALAIVAGLGLLTLLLLLRRRPALVVLMLRVASRFQGSGRPPPLRLSPTRFQLCVLRV